MGTDAGREEPGMAGWASQLDAAPGPAPAEELRVPAAEGWSRFQSLSAANSGTGELPGRAVRSAGSAGCGLAERQGRSCQERHRLRVLTCSAHRAGMAFPCAICAPGAQAVAREDARRRRDSSAGTGSIWSTGARLIQRCSPWRMGRAGTSPSSCEQQEQCQVLARGVLLWMDALPSWHG